MTPTVHINLPISVESCHHLCVLKFIMVVAPEEISYGYREFFRDSNEENDESFYADNSNFDEDILTSNLSNLE